MIRLFDIIFSVFGVIILAPLFALITMTLFVSDGSPIFSQKRVGRDQNIFELYKFRTMIIGAGDLGTHLIDPSYITPVGSFLRRTKLDELPQLWNILKGEMSFVGPRPCLLNQHEVIAERQKLGVFDARPGLTGLAQINHIDMSNPKKLSSMDKEMIETLDYYLYFRYLIQTFLGKGYGDRVNDN